MDPRTMTRFGKKYGLVLGLAVVLTISAAAFAGQDSPALDERVSLVLEKFPAATAEEKNRYAAELVALGAAGVRETCQRLSVPGADDDSLARYALDAVALYVTRPGAESERMMFVKEVLRGVERLADADVKAFLMELLRIAGKDEMVRPLAKYLNDPALSAPAARALEAVRTAGAEAALMNALEEARPDTAGVLIQALGAFRSAAAAKAVLPLTSNPKPRIREAALDALAETGVPFVESLFMTVPITATPTERARAASRYLLYARRLWESGRGDAAEKICRDFLRGATLGGESQVRTASLSLLAEIKGAGVLPDLMEAALSLDPPFRQAAVGLAERLPGGVATPQWLALFRNAQGGAQADIIAALGRRGDKAALAAVREKIGSDEPKVRLAAAAAAVRLGGADVLDDIWPLFQTEDEDQIRTMKQAFQALPAARVIPKAAELISTAGPAARAALIEILAEARAVDHAALVIAQARSENEFVRKAALSAAESLGRPEDVSALIDILLAAPTSPEIALIQNALAAAANRIADPERRADAIVASARTAPGPKRADLVRSLAKVGGEEALRFVVGEAHSGDPQIQAAGLYALANWKDATVLDELFRIARAAADRKTRYLALQGIARLTADPAFGDDKRLSILKDAMSVAAEANEKGLALGALAALRTMDALRTAAAYLDDAATRARAAQAAVRIAQPAPGYAGLSDFETAVILKKAVLFVENEYDRAEAERYANGLLLKAGFVPLFNDKSLRGWKGLVADPPKRAKMAPDALARAQKIADESMRAHWKVREEVLTFDGKGESLCTAKDFADFELFVDWKIEPKGDSGIYLRGSPQVQIWDETQSPDGSGGLYNNKIHPSKPLLRADRPVGEWNTFQLKMVGENVTVWLNGVLVADNVIMENYWERDKSIYPTGQIELQAHSTPLYFKNIYIREIK
jgi:HEAT repeat protein